MGRFCYHGYLLIFIIALTGVLGRSFDNRRLLRVEPLKSIQFEIAPRPDQFYAKRSLTRNPDLVVVPSRPSSLEHDDLLWLQLEAYNQTFHLHLEPNLDLFHPDASTWHRGQGEPLRHEQFRIYRGHTVTSRHSRRRWEQDQAGVSRDDGTPGVIGWARIVVRQDLTRPDLAHPVFEGAFQARGDVYHIKTVRNYKLAKHEDDAQLYGDDDDVAMVIYRDSDTLTVPFVQPDDSSSVMFDRMQQDWWGVFRPAPAAAAVNALPGMVKRDTTGCPTSTMIAYMVAAADCTYTRYYGSVEEARYQIINDWNSASAVYEDTLNIRLGLINITIMPEECSEDISISWNRACSSSYTLSERLSDFSLWRSYYSDDGAALYHLMTACSSGLEVGIAWLRQLCNTDASSQTSNGVTQYVSGTGVSSIIRDEWKVVAHEIGHGFGAIHDCTSDNCPCGTSCSCCPLGDTTCDAGGTYIMNPTNNVSSNSFSPCSITTICELYPALGTCLESPGSRTIQTLQMCGNGIKEDGEDCDPGGRNSTCCDPDTCKFINGAVCDDATDLCCNNCQLQPSTYVCRPAENECDVAEMCTGTSGDCPEDQYIADGTSCGDDGLQCASGQCTSRDQQCIDRGSGLSITGACSALGSSCNLACSASNTSSCVIFTGHFLDGTPCGLGGMCSNGDCDYGNTAHRALLWLQNNKAIAIPVGIVLAIILILLCCWCFFRGCCCWQGYTARKRKLHQANMRPMPVVPPTPPVAPLHSEAAARMSRGGGGGGPPQSPPPPPPSYQQANASRWVDPTPYNGPAPVYSPPPPPQRPTSSPPPPPAHTVRAQSPS